MQVVKNMNLYPRVVATHFANSDTARAHARLRALARVTTPVRLFMSFHCSFGGAPLERIVVEACAEAGLVRSLPRYAGTLLQWASRSRTDWSIHAAGLTARTEAGAGAPTTPRSLIVSSYPVRAVLADKLLCADLHAWLVTHACAARSSVSAGAMYTLPSRPLSPLSCVAHLLVGALLPASRIVPEEAVDAAAARIAALQPQTTAATDPQPAWFVKNPSVNNALGVHAAASTPAQLASAIAACREAACIDAVGASSVDVAHPPPLLAQRACQGVHTTDGGRKFHVRVNVLAMGALCVFVHRDAVVHVACEPYVHSEWDNPYIHVTNHCAQRA
ncbi:hypothetical protein EON67_10295, partial [archaeon]